MTTKKTTPPALELPPRPPSKVEQGLQGAAIVSHPADGGTQDDADREAAKADTPEAKVERAIAAMVAAGLSQEFAEAAFVMSEPAWGDDPTPADVHAAVGEAARAAEDFGAPLCTHGCHGPSWADIPAERDAVGCEHGSYSRKPSK